MSMQTFKPTIWEARLLHHFHKASIADLITTKPVKVAGNKVTFNKPRKGNAKDYKGKVEWDAVSTAPVDLLLDQQKYFAFAMDDIDKAQAAGEVVDSFTSEEAAVMKEKIDTFILSQYTEVLPENVMGTDAAPLTITPANAYDNIVDANTKLSKNKVPLADRYAIIDFDYLGLLSKDDRFTRNYQVLENGVVEGAKVGGSTLLVSEELAKNEKGDRKLLVLHKSAIGYAKQIDQTEALRLQDTFADGIRGLTIFGATTLRPESLVVMTGGYGAEAPETPAAE